MRHAVAMPESTLSAVLPRRLTLAALVAAIVGKSTRSDAQHAHASSPESPEPTGFAAEMDEAMAHMHQAMQIAPEGNPERDFARMMIAHHQGAIDMSLVLLRWSARAPSPVSSPASSAAPSPILRLAQEIIVEQRAEIAVMEQFLRDTAGR
jgi:uncharacterized protein (DUF305 family)